MNEESKLGQSIPVVKCKVHSQMEVPDGKEKNWQGYRNLTKDPSETMERLFITSVEQKLWEQLLGLLSPSLWEVKVSEGIERDSPLISLSGSPGTVMRAKEVISKLLIMVGSQVKANLIDVPQLKLKAVGFFQLHKGLHLFLWEGEAFQFRADAVLRIGSNGGTNYGNTVFAQKVLSSEGSLYTILDIHFSNPPTVELATGMVKLALEAASHKGLQSLVIPCSGCTISTSEAEAIVVGIEAFRRNHPTSPLKSIHMVFGDGRASMVFKKECETFWWSGKNNWEKLKNVLLSLESTRIEVATNSTMKRKTDVVVLPLVLDSDWQVWGPGAHAFTQKVLEVVPQAAALHPGEILLVSSSVFPEFDCTLVYLVRLGEPQESPEETTKQAIRNMVWSCLSTFYGSFLESIVFPVLQPTAASQVVKQECLFVLVEEINQFLKKFPNTWMKLVQIVPLPEWPLPCPIEDCLSSGAEPLGLCHTEEPLFLQYLEENPHAFREFQVQMKKAGYGIQLYSPSRLLMFQAICQSARLLDLQKAFQDLRQKYVLHCETRAEILEALLDQQSLSKRFTSIKIYVFDQMWFVGLSADVASFLECLGLEASRRQLVSWENSAEPLPWYIIAKDIMLQDILPSNPLIKIEITANIPATIRFWGRRQNVEEAERRLTELLRSFRILVVPLSHFQFQFVKAQWGKLFYSNFFLDRSIPAALELSQGVQIAGLDLGKMQEAKEIFKELVCERTVEIAEELKWATECEEWKMLLQSLGTHKEIALHYVAPDWVFVVGLCTPVIQAEESIKAYLRENSSVEKRVKLARPELVLAGKNLLHIMDWEHINMNVILQLHNQPLVLVVSGLKKHVRKAMVTIKRDLDSLVLDTLPLKERLLSEYFSGVGAIFLKDMALKMHCITEMKADEFDCWNSVINSEGPVNQKLATGCSEAIYIIGKKPNVTSLKQIVDAFIVKFCKKSIRNEAIESFRNTNLSEFLKNISHQFPIDISHLQNDELQICGSQEDVWNVLEAVDTKIEEYQTEWIEVKAQYELVPRIIVKESLFQERFPSNLSISTEVLEEEPATLMFQGPRQKLVELERRFKEFLNDFQFLPVPLSKFQFQFVKAHWGTLFDNRYFLDRNIPAILEISEIAQVGGLDLAKIEEAKGMLMKQVCERTIGIAKQLQSVTECEEWKELLSRLKSHSEVAIHYTPSSQVTLVGLCPQIAEVGGCIKEYLRDNSPLEEIMTFTRAELELTGENLLHILDWKSLNVSIEFQPDGEVSSLQVKGLWKFVKEAIQVIKKDLDSLMLCKIPLKENALHKYFSGAGTDLLKETAQEQNCIVKMKIQKSLDCSDGITNSNGNVIQGLGADYWAVIHVVGKESNVTSVKQHLGDFIAKFYEETICSAEIPALSDEILKVFCEDTSHQYPIVLHRLKEKVVWVCGSQEDVENVAGKIYTKLEEAVLKKMQKAQAEHIESKLLSETICWYHMTDAGWSPFDIITNRHLELAYGKKKMWALVPWNREKVKINFMKREGFMQGKRKFRIRREICLWDKYIAPYWEAMDGCLVKKVELQTSSDEYQMIVKNFMRTACDYKVVKVERIQNRYLWVSYCWKRSWMEKKNPERIQNEHILYHGTQLENCSSINEIGFKSACRKGGVYGQGIYFSVAANRSVFYATPDSQALRYMFQARVLTGIYERGYENMTLPPMKQDGKGRYDSLVDVPNKPSIFVIFFDDHVYPEYLITFCGPTLESNSWGTIRKEKKKKKMISLK